MFLLIQSSACSKILLCPPKPVSWTGQNLEDSWITSGENTGDGASCYTVHSSVKKLLQLLFVMLTSPFSTSEVVSTSDQGAHTCSIIQIRDWLLIKKHFDNSNGSITKQRSIKTITEACECDGQKNFVDIYDGFISILGADSKSGISFALLCLVSKKGKASLVNGLSSFLVRKSKLWHPKYIEE